MSNQVSEVKSKIIDFSLEYKKKKRVDGWGEGGTEKIYVNNSFCKNFRLFRKAIKKKSPKNKRKNLNKQINVKQHKLEQKSQNTRPYNRFLSSVRIKLYVDKRNDGAGSLKS